MNFENKKVVVIGGSVGMGLSIAKEAYKKGAQVVIGGRTLEKLENSSKEIGENVEFHVIDTMSEESVKNFFNKVGAIDYLTTPGSSVKMSNIKELPLEDAMYTMNNKFFGQYLCAKYAQINKGGSITLFSGILSRRPGQSDSILAPTNAAVETLGKALARELAPIRVNTIAPGLVAGTDAYKMMPDEMREGMYNYVSSILPLGKVGSAEEIANVSLMVMANTFMTGSTVDIDGGGLLV